jgi:signal transduction histidine kinase
VAVEAAEITRLLNEIIGQSRDLARGLNPVGLEQIGITAALEALASNVQALHGVACRFQCDYPFLSLGPEVETHLYRIAQEAVNNAIAHGRGKRIDISLGFGEDGEGLLSIRDDGIGIPEKAFQGQKGIGLHTMNYRCRLIAQRLHLSIKTIESHREHIKQKLTIDSGTELTRRAIHWVETGRTS